MALRTVGVRLQAEVSGYINSIRTAGGATKDFVGGLDKAAKAGKLDAVADQAGRMGLVLGGAFALAVGAAAKFDKQMSEVGAVSGATSGQLEQLRQAALDAGKDTQYSATEAAKAEAELAKAGLSTADILGGALSGSLSLAAAGSLDLADAADISAKAMNTFQLSGGDTGHIADLLAAAANKSATDVHEMGEALKQGGLAANAAGMSLDDTVGVLAAFADRALVGSDAGTSLKSMLLMLQAPSKKAHDTMDELGISVYDAQGQFIGAAKLAGVLRDRLGGLTQEQRNAALANIFGADAMRAANILYTIGESGVRDYTTAVDDQGAAAEVARKKTDNLSGDVERLTGSLETLAIESGSGANGGLRLMVQTVGALVDQFGAMPPVIGSSVTVLAGLGGATLLALAGWVKMRRGIADALDELRQTGPVGARAADGLEKTSKWAGRAAIAFAALQVAGVVMEQFTHSATDVDALNASLERFSKTGEVGGELARQFGVNLENSGRQISNASDGWIPNLGRSIESVLPPAKQFNELFYGGSFTGDAQRFRDLDAAMAQMVNSGNLDKARELYGELLTTSGASADDLDKLLPKFTDASFKAQTMGEKAYNAANGITAVGDAAGHSAEEIDTLNKAFDGLFGIEMDLDEANLKFREGVAELKAEMVDGARSLDTNTKAGQDNVQAILEQIQKIKDLRDARYAHNGSLEEANALYVKDIDGLRRSMLQAGFTKEAVDALIGKYRQVPAQVKTAVTANTSGATAAIAGFQKKINTIDGRTITVYARFNSTGLYIPGQGTIPRRWGGATEHAEDGLLRDAGVYSPVGPARYAFAEPATGGEAFIPRLGDQARSMATWEYVGKNWLGVKPAPQYTTAPASTTQTIVHEYRITLDGTGVLRDFRKELRAGGKRGVIG